MGEKNGYSLEACQPCGSVMVMPAVTAADLEKYFGDIQPEATHAANPEGEIAHYRKILEKIKKTYGGQSFLDVCCRQGYAVKAAKDIGLQAKGIDSHDFYTRFAKQNFGGDHFETSTAKEYANTGKHADIIFSIEAFAEQPDLEGYTAVLAALLSPKGKIYIEEPDGNSFWLPKDFTRWAFVEPPLSFNYPSYKGLKTLLARHGLKIEKKFFSWGPMLKLIVTKK